MWRIIIPFIWIACLSHAKGILDYQDSVSSNTQDGSLSEVKFIEKHEPPKSETLTNGGHVVFSTSEAKFKIPTFEFLRLTAAWKDDKTTAFLYSRIEEEIDFASVPRKHKTTIEGIIERMMYDGIFRAYHRTEETEITEISKISYRNKQHSGMAYINSSGTIIFTIVQAYDL